MASAPLSAELAGAAGHLLVDGDPGDQREQTLRSPSFVGAEASKDLDPGHLRTGGRRTECGDVFACEGRPPQMIDEDGRVEDDAHPHISLDRSASARRSLST